MEITQNQLIIQRIEDFISEKKISKRRFEIDLEFSNGFLSTSKKQDSSLGVDKILRITEKYKELSIKWLLTGEGDMLEKGDHVEKNIQIAHNIQGNNHQSISDCEKEKKHLEEMLAEKKEEIAFLREILKSKT